MPRAMPPLAASFSREVDQWLDLARSGEIIRVAAAGNPVVLHELRPARLEALYEVAYLRIFLSWEVYLEETFHRLLRGYSVAAAGTAMAGVPYTLRQRPYRSLADASNAVLGGNSYVSWASPELVIKRSRRFISSGPHEMVCQSALARLRPFTDVRNRIAHSSTSAVTAFDAATTTLVGHRYRGSSPGRFLREWDTVSTPRQRMLTVLGQELVSLATQIT